MKNCTEELPCDLSQAIIAPYKGILKRCQNTVSWCNLKLAQSRGLQFYQTRSNAVILHNTLPAICFEKAVCMKTKEELFHKVCLTPRLPRVVIKANSYGGQQDLQEQDARISGTAQADHRAAGKLGATTWITGYLAYLFR